MRAAILHTSITPPHDPTYLKPSFCPSNHKLVINDTSEQREVMQHV